MAASWILPFFKKSTWIILHLFFINQGFFKLWFWRKIDVASMNFEYIKVLPHFRKLLMCIFCWFKTDFTCGKYYGCDHGKSMSSASPFIWNTNSKIHFVSVNMTPLQNKPCVNVFFFWVSLTNPKIHIYFENWNLSKEVLCISLDQTAAKLWAVKVGGLKKFCGSDGVKPHAGNPGLTPGQWNHLQS